MPGVPELPFTGTGCMRYPSRFRTRKRHNAAIYFIQPVGWVKALLLLRKNVVQTLAYKLRLRGVVHLGKRFADFR